MPYPKGEVVVVTIGAKIHWGVTNSSKERLNCGYPNSNAEALRMGTLKSILQHPDDFYPLLKLKMAARNAEKQIPPEPHWAFCYTMLHKVSRSFALVIQQLDTDLRNAVRSFGFRSRFLLSIPIFLKLTSFFFSVRFAYSIWFFERSIPLVCTCIFD